MKVLPFFSKRIYRIDENGRNMTRPFITIAHFENKKLQPYPYESDNTMLFPLLVLGLFTLFVGSIGIPFNQGGVDVDILSKWLISSLNLLHQKLTNSTDWYEFLKDAIFSVSIAYLGILIASFLYKAPYSYLFNFSLINSVVKRGPTRILWEKIINGIYAWSYNRAYIDSFYTRFLTGGTRGFAELTHFFDRRLIDAITNGVGLISFFVGEAIKYVGGGRISSYLFFYFSYVSICLFIFFIIFIT